MNYDIKNKVRILYNKYDKGSITFKALGSELDACAKKIEAIHEKAVVEKSKTELQKWLTSNYYAVEKEIQDASQNLKYIKKNKVSANLGLFSAIFNSIIGEDMIPLTEENLEELLYTFNEERNISIDEFDSASLAIKLVLLNMVGNSFKVEYDAETAVEMMKYAVTGFVKLAAIDFMAIEEKISIVEEILRQDPANEYLNMTVGSRKHYRNTVAELSKITGKSEKEIALKALHNSLNGESLREKHIGYHILKNNEITEKNITKGENMLLANVVVPLIIAFILGAITGSYAVILLTYFPCWEIVKFISESIVMAKIKADFIPQMDMEKVAIKPKTVLLVSTLMFAPSRTAELEKKLEQLYFCNRFDNVYICILGDFKESKHTKTPEQLVELEATKRVIENLNNKYTNNFMLFVRNQTYSKSMDLYTAFERKRGAITEFIRFVKNETLSDSTFVGDISAAKQLKYCIALDIDTKLLFNSAQGLIATALHPLNKPIIDTTNGTVVDGYGILVPKMVSDLDNYKSTIFSKVMEGCGGITGYDTGAKDFYQDLFGESIFSGKGLIDIDTFFEVLDNRLPENQILSHDVIEGAYLRTGFVSNIEMTDSCPSTPTAWINRLHRWIRGDWQNSLFLLKTFNLEEKGYYNPISKLSKYKLFDNLRRSLNPVFWILAIVISIFLQPKEATAIIIIVFLSINFADLCTLIGTLFSHGMFSISRKFFSQTMPKIFEILGKTFFSTILLVTKAVSALDAMIRSVYRTFVSRKNMLEWTTSSETAKTGLNLKKYILPQILGMFILVFGNYWYIKVFGLIFSLIIPFVIITSRPRKEHTIKLTAKEKETLISYNMAMWQFFEDFANEENNFLPPDNVQEAPVYALANRTSPTNIGVMLLSILSARDYDFIDSAGLYERLNRSIATIEKLEKWHGNLYNWYATNTLELLKPSFVSTVDSGNFVCCLVALKEGLKEYSAEELRLSSIIERLKKLIDKTDLSVFFSCKRKLFSIGYDVENDCLSGSHYDFLMSEARMTSYFAIAKRQVSEKHWGAMNRSMSKSGSYCGAVSWTGTMFEYFMPQMLLPIYDGSFLNEALRYCVYSQKNRTKKTLGVWGISESGYYAFDSNLNYQYKAHGVQNLGVKIGLDLECVLSPYSTFLTVPFNPISSMENLAKLKSLNLWGKYGFYEAIDFTKERLNGSDFAIIKSYMSHHLGMSIIASNNAIFENRMQKRFMKDNHMKSAKEFLQEKIPKDNIIYDNKKKKIIDKNEETNLIDEEFTNIYPQAPRVGVYANGEITAVLTDTGVSYLAHGDTLLTRKSKDFLRNPQGIYVFAKVGNVFVSHCKAPFYSEDVANRVKIKADSMTYYGTNANVKLTVDCSIHKTISAEIMEIELENNSTVKPNAEILFYFEPILATYSDYIAHQAYSKLFITGQHNKESKTITFYRRNKFDNSDLFLTVGILEDMDFEFELKRENLMSAPNGVLDLKHFTDKKFECKGSQIDTCCGIKIKQQISGNSSIKATIIISSAKIESESIENIINLRRSFEQEHKAISPVVRDTIEGRLALNILPQILFGKKDSRANLAAIEDNNLSQSSLWQLGVSGDIPIVVIEVDKSVDTQRLEAYVKLQKTLKIYHITFDLCILFDSKETNNAPYEILKILNNSGVSDFLNNRGGVFSIDIQNFSADVINLLKASASHISPKSMVIMTMPNFEYMPIKINPVSKKKVDTEGGLKVIGGEFFGGKFYVDKTSPLPYSHILSNPTFGTLVSDKALGFTWAVNSRENKITPWLNDITSDNTGEMILVYVGGECYDITNGSQAIFSKSTAVYKGEFCGLSSKLTIKISDTGCVKYCDLHLDNNSGHDIDLDVAYYIEPVLGVNRDNSKFIKSQFKNNALVLNNPYQQAVPNSVILTSSCKINKYTTNRAEFFMGNFSCETSANHDPCAAISVTKKLPPKREENIRFILSYGANEKSADYMAHNPPMLSDKIINSIKIKTPDKYLDEYINNFAVHQILSSRIQGRTAFYQCGGAYGFRDQLQDICAYLYIDKDVAKRQIYKCCAVQFLEGDVLHWWHTLPKSGGGIKGVRTKFSDDLVWLPYAVSHYVEKTGDSKILDVKIAYIKGDLLTQTEHEKYFEPQKSDIKATVYMHCIKALEKAYNIGNLGLVLIGTGDWNDGFSEVGKKGKGQSVWLSMFLAHTMEKFIPVVLENGDKALADLYKLRASKLKKAVDESCWDGEWYLRAFYDDGTKMGSRENNECSIDLLPQSFAVFADMPDRERVMTALNSAVSKLVDTQYQIIKLFDPPLQHSEQNAGYVKAYPSGIRENGGQYTHGAIWLAKALFEVGKADDGYNLIKMLNPAYRASNPHLGEIYKTEPYYIAADIYTNESAKGHGGWSMYTGAAAWYYRTVIEQLLGIKLKGDYMEISPNIPEDWDEFSITALINGTSITINAVRTGEKKMLCDMLLVDRIPLDKRHHIIDLNI